MMQAAPERKDGEDGLPLLPPYAEWYRAFYMEYVIAVVLAPGWRFWIVGRGWIYRRTYI